MRLPEEFEEKMKGLLIEEFSNYIACYDKPRYYGLRVNTDKISAEEFEKIIMTVRRMRRQNILTIMPGFIICRSQAP